MNSIPEDIMRVAVCVLDAAATFPDGTYTDDAYSNIAHAILTERQRCADIASGWSKDDQQNGEVRLVAAYIWRSIQNGENHE